jgi:prevent-host-death family protein
VNLTTWCSVSKTVSAAEANRQFSRLLREVNSGQTYVVTAHGKPVAQLSPINAHAKVIAGARKALLARLRSQRAIDAGRWSRDELYEDVL